MAQVNLIALTIDPPAGTRSVELRTFDRVDDERLNELALYQIMANALRQIVGHSQRDPIAIDVLQGALQCRFVIHVARLTPTRSTARSPRQ